MSNFTKLNCNLKKFLLTAMLLFSFFISFSQSVATFWQFNRPGPIGYDITDIYYVNNTVGYAVGSSGSISRTTDAGRTWVHDYLPGRPFINAIAFSSEKVGYVVLLDGRVAKTTNRGVSWNFVTKPGTTTSGLNSLHFFDDNNGIVIGDVSAGTAGIYKTTNGGNTWTQLNTVYPVQNRSLAGIAFLNANVGYICGTSGHVAKTIDGGATWTNVSMATGNPVQLGTVNPVSQTYSGIAVIDAQTVVLGSLNNSMIIKTIDGGTTWVCKAASNGAPNIIAGSQSLKSMAWKGNDIAVIAGASCGVSHDAGETWSFNRPYPTGNVKTGLGFTSIVITPDRGVKMAGAYGVMVDSASGAANWDTSYYKCLDYHPNGFRAILGISALDKNNIVAAGNRGVMHKSTDGGKTWLDRTIKDFQIPQVTIEIDIKDVKYPAADALYMCATNGYVYRSLDGGNTWPENVGDPYYFNVPVGSMAGMDFIDKNTGWVCGGTGGTNGGFVYRTTDGGLTYTKQTTTFTGTLYIYSVDFVSATVGYACGTGGRMYKTTDGGNNWVQQTVPATVTTNLFSVAFASADTGWAAGIQRLMYTTDGGTTWTQQGPTNVIFNKFMPVNGKIGVVMGNGGVCLKTIDGGTTWTDFSAPTSDALFGATFATPYNSITPNVNPADVDMFVGAGKAAGAQSPTILTAKMFYTAPAPAAPIISNISDKCVTNAGAKGKIMNLPAYTAINITVDGDTVLYSPQDSTFSYFENGFTAGVHTVKVTFTNTTASSSTTATYTVFANVTPTVTIASNDADNVVCAGQNVTFTGTVVGGGAAPIYQWRVNGATAVNNNPVFNYIPANGDVFTLSIVSNFLCLVTPNAASNAITITVPQINPVITVTSANTLSITNPLANGVYQWLKDGQAIAGATGTSLTVTDFGMYSVRQTFNTCSNVSSAIVMGPGTTGNNDVIVFPVPANDKMFARTYSTGLVIKSMKIYDSNGQLVITKTFAANNLVEFNVGKLQKGVYVIKFETNGDVISKTFMKL